MDFGFISWVAGASFAAANQLAIAAADPAEPGQGVSARLTSAISAASESIINMPIGMATSSFAPDEAIWNDQTDMGKDVVARDGPALRKIYDHTLTHSFV